MRKDGDGSKDGVDPERVGRKYLLHRHWMARNGVEQEENEAQSHVMRCLQCRNLQAGGRWLQVIMLPMDVNFQEHALACAVISAGSHPEEAARFANAAAVTLITGLLAQTCVACVADCELKCGLGVGSRRPRRHPHPTLPSRINSQQHPAMPPTW